LSETEMAKVGVIMLNNTTIVGDIEIDDAVSSASGGSGAMWTGGRPRGR
jgi:hypothetical protein